MKPGDEILLAAGWTEEEVAAEHAALEAWMESEEMREVSDGSTTTSHKTE